MRTDWSKVTHENLGACIAQEEQDANFAAHERANELVKEGITCPLTMYLRGFEFREIELTERMVVGGRVDSLEDTQIIRRSFMTNIPERLWNYQPRSAYLLGHEHANLARQIVSEMAHQSTWF